MKNIIIHIGKCSGTLLQYNLDLSKIDYTSIHHANQINPEPIIPEKLINGEDNYQLIFCIRHPIDRFISAFNFKFTLTVIKKVPHYFKGELEGFRYFKTVQNLLEKLYNDDGSVNIKAIDFCSKCDHISYGLHHYLKNFNNNYNIRIIRHENSQEDYKKIFNKEMFIPDNNLRPNFKSKIKSDIKLDSTIEITKKAYNNLKRFLKKDMEIITRLEEYNLITPEYKDFCLNKLPDNIIIK